MPQLTRTAVNHQLLCRLPPYYRQAASCHQIPCFSIFDQLNSASYQFPSDQQLIYQDCLSLRSERVLSIVLFLSGAHLLHLMLLLLFAALKLRMKHYYKPAVVLQYVHVIFLKQLMTQDHRLLCLFLLLN